MLRPFLYIAYRMPKRHDDSLLPMTTSTMATASLANGSTSPKRKGRSVFPWRKVKKKREYSSRKEDTESHPDTLLPSHTAEREAMIRTPNVDDQRVPGGTLYRTIHKYPTTLPTSNGGLNFNIKYH